MKEEDVLEKSGPSGSGSKDDKEGEWQFVSRKKLKKVMFEPFKDILFVKSKFSLYAIRTKF